MEVIRSLMCVYPKAWRSEYGRELASMLYRRPLSATVMLDVLRNGIWQKLRYAPPWQIGGSILMLWMVFGTALNSVAPLSKVAYGRFFDVNLLVYFLIGCRTATQSDKTIRNASFAAGKASLLGIVPEVLMLSLWMAKLIHPTVLDQNGSPSTMGHGLTEFCLRLSQGVPVNPYDLPLLLPLVTILPAMFVGYLGAMISKTISAFKAGLHRA
jgi:hypothetical protein